MPVTESCTVRLLKLPLTKKSCSVNLSRLSVIKKRCSVRLSRLLVTDNWCSVRLCRLPVTKWCSVKLSTLPVTQKRCSVRLSRLLMATIAQKLGKQGSESMGLPHGEETDQQTDPHEKPQAEAQTNPHEKPQDTNGEAVGVSSEQGQDVPPEELPVPSSTPGNRLQRKRVPNPKYRREPDTTNLKCPDSTKKPRKKMGLKISVVSNTETDQQEPDKKTPKPPKKTPAKKTPQKKAPQKKPVVSSIDSDKGLIKQTPAKKTSAKKIQKETPQVNSTPAPAVPELRETPEEPETTPSGRPKRRAAKAALQYLHTLAKEVFNQPDNGTKNDWESSPVPSPSSTQPQKRTRGKGKKRKAPDFDSDNAAEDVDFVPENQDTEEESEAEDTQEDLDLEKRHTPLKDLRSRRISRGLSSQVRYHGNSPNGLSNNMMGPIWMCTKTTKTFRDEHCNEWVFAEWMPSEKDWHCLSDSEAEKYLPQEMMSTAFTFSREGIREETPLHRMKRFECLPPHPERWDMLFYTGGPVWAMDWCPSPDGAPASQYAAIYCHRNLDDQHRMNELYTKPGLIQIWDLGQLQYNTSPQSSPRLAYGIAQDKGFVWNLKWCPGGAWELPTTNRKAPHMPRLGLLAASTSDGHITIYSLPHPDTLMARRKHTAKGGACPTLMICQVQGVITLKRGSFKTNHDEKNNQVLSMDWLPVKPHNILAAGFYDGTVALWNLSSKSILQRVRAPDRSFTLYPYHCFIAHDNATRALSFCHASSSAVFPVLPPAVLSSPYPLISSPLSSLSSALPPPRDLMVTAGDDRLVKMWDLRRTWEPCQSFKRFLSTEAAWPLHWAGVFISQESTYATFGQHGLNYFDSGYLGFKPLFLVPRKGTMWSLSISDWLNTAVTADSVGDVIMVLIPNLFNNPCYLKRSIDRRFPVFRTEMVQLKEEVEENEGGVGEEGSGSTSNGTSHHTPQTYRETAQKYYLHYHDMDMRTFKNAQSRAPWKHMQVAEAKGGPCLDLMPLASLTKVRFNPNLCAQSWVLSGGQAGLVRAHCLRAMNSSHINKMVQESQAQFSTMFPQDTTDSQGDASAVRHTTEKL
ncbi:general transcription factor 3C polypeptide 2 isoform X1 [Oncorhynchus nerka]|uniref:general transcription factor 3C polypeptide 2 isoform X1 n=1 Tax=Oncorhynchus nerka TaxID=8023 RepID=UPI00112FF3A3|nr:general transcription factor 3C polypeptide 2 isoform X1 [Oncorhynchus nerka]XP_029532537.1 general transcription factor 3C polypeptide 2 isoform X1 [Oncorhynchus nerka]